MLCDASFLIRLADPSEPKSAECRQQIKDTSQRLLTTWCCIAETMHLLGRRRGGWYKQQIVAKMLTQKVLLIYEIEQSSCERLFSLMAQYKDRPMDLADASLVLVAEQTSERQILTLDADFLFYRICGKETFEIVMT